MTKSQTSKTDFRLAIARRRARGGFLYLAVLVVALMVAVSSMSAISIMQSNERSVTDGLSAMRAQTLADSAIALGLSRINNDPGWRSTFLHGVQSSPITIGSGGTVGTISFRLEDSDGNLANDSLQAVNLIGVGRSGSAAAACSVQLEPAGSGLPILDYSVAVGSSLSSTTSVHWVQDAGIYVRGNVAISSPACFLSDQIVANGWISHDLGAYFLNTYGLSDYQSALRFPAANWSDYYSHVATSISIDDIPISGGAHRIQNVAIHPGNNPFGQTNALGVYKIDCGGANLQITGARLSATLLITNPGTNSSIYGSVFWQPAVDRFPILLVQGDITIAHGDLPLHESTIGQNLNPSGFAYRGVEDSDTSDVYPSRLSGLIYVDGTLKLGSQTTVRTEIEGCVVCQTLSPLGNTKVMHIPEIIESPPPGFRSDDKMRIVTGTYRRQSL
ncbi:MAG: hypothetical protein R3C05_19935 [Pirellulaceae bacterium]